MRVRPAFVLTTCALGACSSEPRRTADPPPGSASVAGSATTAPDPSQRAATLRKRQPKGPKPEAVSLLLERAPEGMRQLNPTDAKGRPIYLGADESCWIQEPRTDPRPEGPARFGPWVTRLPVDCPTAMDDPSWALCTGKTLHYSAKQDLCACFPEGGNPPPPPLVVPCPADTKP